MTADRSGADPLTRSSAVGGARVGLAIGLISALALLSGLLRGIPKVYDLPDHLGYAWQVLQAFERSDFYPRWLASVNDGFGEATLVFYPPVLPWTSAAIGFLFRGDVLIGLYVTLFLFAVLGGVGAYRFVARVFGPTAGALAGLAFAIVPYRVFEMYGSGLYSAFAAAGIAPWALGALAKVAETPDAPPGESLRSVCLWALTFAGIALTNLPSAVLWTYLVAIWVLAELLATRRWKVAVRVFAGGVWGCLIAAVYLVPAVVEMRAVQIPLEEVYRSNFLFQVSGSWMKPGLKSMFDRMGLYPAAALIVSLGILVLARERGALTGQRARVFVLQTATLGLMALVLATPISLWAWRWLPQLSRVDMPWRLLEPLGLITACATAAAVSLLARGSGRLPLRAIALVFFGSLAILCLAFDRRLSDANGHMTPAETRAAIPAFARKEVFFLLKGARRAAEMAATPPVSCETPCRV
ncbi:MAG TPA: hypothetical protein VEG84_02800, partial [Thermoanaerobaculia bacterium]|nr:hypothetical protein [Thermoanaerobaculia bacterium]